MPVTCVLSQYIRKGLDEIRTPHEIPQPTTEWSGTICKKPCNTPQQAPLGLYSLRGRREFRQAFRGAHTQNFKRLSNCCLRKVIAKFPSGCSVIPRQQCRQAQDFRKKYFVFRKSDANGRQIPK